MSRVCLSSIAFARAQGLRVRSMGTGTEGLVTHTHHDPRYLPEDPDGQITTIAWDNGRQSALQHYLFDRVEVLNSALAS